MTKLNPLPRAAATAAVAAGTCLLACACPQALAAGRHASTAAAGTSGSSENLPVSLGNGSPGSSTVGGSGSSIVRTIVGLAIVIAVIWGLTWILRQVKSSREGGASARSSAGLHSLAALSLSSGRSVHLVRAGTDYLLLGSAEQGVVPIHRYTEAEAREAGLADVIDGVAAGTGGPSRRRALLRPSAEEAVRFDRTQLGRETHPHPPGHDPMRMPSPGPGTSLIDRLRELTVRR